MSNRVCFLVLSVICLLSGGIFYILWRDTSYIALIFNKIDLIILLRKLINNKILLHISFYLPDYLWGLGLCCGLFWIFGDKIKNIVLCSLFTIVYGIIWEILQYFSVVNGTGDLLDMIMYLLAVLTALIIFILRRMKNEENFKFTDGGIDGRSFYGLCFRKRR